MRVLLLVLLLLPQLGSARVFMCVDEATGKKTFSDKGCQTSFTQEEVRIQATNVDSGRRTADPAARKAWVSDRDTRKTGRDYFAEKRDAMYDRAATASASAMTSSEES